MLTAAGYVTEPTAVEPGDPEVLAVLERARSLVRAHEAGEEVRHDDAQQAGAELRTLYEQHEDNVHSEQAAREFAFNRARAIVLADDPAASQTLNLLLAPESWKEGRVYETTVDGSARRLRCVRLLRRADDYVRVTFEWVGEVESVA